MDTMDKYYLALGNFVDAFAMAENMTFLVLRTTAKLDSATGRALFSGTRARGATDLIRRLHESRGTTLPPIINNALSHLATINTARDLILHHGTERTDEGLRVSNDIRTLTRSVKVLSISPEYLEAMTEDLMTITMALMVHAIPMEDFNKYDIPEFFWTKFDEDSRKPWRHTPAQPNRAQGKSSEALEERPPRPESSQP